MSGSSGGRHLEETTENRTDEDEGAATGSDGETSRRRYVEVQPSGRPVSPSTAAAHFRRIHGLADDDGGVLSTLLGLLLPSDPPPTVEFSLVSDGEGGPIRYYVGIDTPHDDSFGALENVLRGLFPNEYELRRVQNRPGPVERVLDATRPGGERDDGFVTGVEYYGTAKVRRDWQTELAAFDEFRDDDQARLPLSAVVDAMAECAHPVVYQALVRPKPDWTRERDDRHADLENVQESYMSSFWNVIMGPPDPDAPLPVENEERIASIEERDTRCSFAVTARAAIIESSSAAHSATSADATARKLATAFGAVGKGFHEVDARIQRGDDGRALLDAIAERRFHEPSYERLRTALPFTTNWSRGIVADRTEVGSFCLLGGGSLTVDGDRAVGTTRRERTAVARPPDQQLDRYDGAGMPLGRPITADGESTDDPVVLPPSLQRRHVAILGTTGAGKTTALTNAVLHNSEATDGADVVLSPIGDGLATDYLRAHYARHGHLDDVVYFDCAAWLPATSFFDVRADLAAGVARTTAVENRVDHYVEILEAVMGKERFERAVRSPTVVRYLVKAMFDPGSGADAFAHADLLDAARTMAAQKSPPSVNDDRLQRLLDGVASGGSRSFDEVMTGAMNRMESIPADRRLGALFDHVPTGDDPHFDLAEYLDEDVVVVVDTSGLRSEAQRVIALVVLSNLWTALRRRAARSDGESSPLVNLYVEEAASLAVSDLLGDVLARGRGLDCSVTLAMQFPGQFRHDAPAVQDELLNNVGTILSGPVPDDRRLAGRLASGDMDADDVATRLRALERGEWLVSLPADFGETPPRPFQVESVPLPPGTAGNASPGFSAAFEQELAALEERTRERAGIDVPEPDASADPASDLDPSSVRLDSALPHTGRLPKPVRYDDERHALRCAKCEGRHAPDVEGMRRAIECCSSMEQVVRESVPICDLGLKLSPEECADAAPSTRQLLFLQAVYNAARFRYDPLEYDIMRDSMTVLREYVGIDKESVEDLVEEGLLIHDTDYPHRLYTVTPDGRDVIGERYREGLDFGDGLGDMHESTEHRMAVELARRYLVAEYEDDADSPVADVRSYHDVDGRERLDVAGLDDEGELVVAVEVERMNGMQTQAVPDDYDKLASYDLEEAIWLVMSEDDAHELLRVLNDPSDGVPRVEKSYSRSTRSQYFSIDTDGLTDVFIVDHLREALSIE